jgi:hypothetical protein
MNSKPINQDHQVNSPLRSTLPVEIREPSSAPQLSSPSPEPVLDFISSDATLDRYQEIIDPAGWRLDTYRRNPVFQNAHQYGDILFTLGKALITEIRTRPPCPSGGRGLEREGSYSPRPLDDRGIEGEGSYSPRPSDGRGIKGEGPYLFQRIEFAVSVNPFAKIAYGLYRGKFLNAVSVGFVPIRWEDGEDRDQGGARSPSAPSNLLSHGLSPSGSCELSSPSTINHHRSSRSGCLRRYLEQELLEVSAVAIPANPSALALALKSGALVKSDLQDVVELCRSLVAPCRPNSARTAQLLTFARTLHRILRSA